jgi:hypothetical protein
MLSYFFEGGSNGYLRDYGRARSHELEAEAIEAEAKHLAQEWASCTSFGASSK